MPESALGYTVVWVAILLGGIAIEVATLNLVSVWFSVGALAALIALTFRADFLVQLIVFAIISAVMLGLIRPLAKDILKPRGAKTNADRIIGETATVVDEISNAQSKGQVKVFGQIWSARSANDEIIPVGASVKILSITGVKAIVEPQRKED